jgi:hypothetical protein
LLRQITSEQYIEWKAYAAIEPFGEYYDWVRTGIIASAALAPHIRKGAKAPQPKDFMPDEKAFMKRSEPKKQNVAEMKAVMLDMVASAKRAGKNKKR